MNRNYNKEANRMRVLAGLKPLNEGKLNNEELLNEALLNEGFLKNLATAIAIIASTTGAMGQTVQDLPYDDATQNKIEVALENPQVVDKLIELGVEDNNIEKAYNRLKGKKVEKVATRTATSDAELAKYLKLGYHLTAVHTDTIVDTVQQVAPDAIVTETVIEFKDNAFFASGAFELGSEQIQEIKSVLDSIEADGDVLLSVVIESSTDKQGLSTNLKKTLMTRGYSADNQGLSQARNNSVMKIIDSVGVDSSIIDQDVKSEQGTGVINQSARYVRVKFQVLEVSTMEPSPEQAEIVTSYPQTFEVVKAYPKAGKKKTVPPVKMKKCKTKIKVWKPGQLICPIW